ncbi:hypothetical protein ALC60_11462, partial [Trachymyrmex zeteki]
GNCVWHGKSTAFTRVWIDSERSGSFRTYFSSLRQFGTREGGSRIRPLAPQTGCQLIIQFEIFHENHAIRGVAHGDFLQRDRKDKRRLQWKMSLARRDWPEDSSQHLRLRKLTLDDRLLPSVRAIRVKEAGNCDDTIAYRWMSDIHTHAERCTYLHRNTSSLVLFVVNRGKIDFILRSVPSISSCDTSRRVYWLCRTQPRVRREIHAPRVAPITPVDD